MKKETTPAIADAPKEKNNDQNKILFEPVLNGNEPKWLCITEKETFPVIMGRTASDIIKDPLPPEKIRTFATQDPDMWQCKKCGGLIKSKSNELKYSSSFLYK